MKRLVTFLLVACFCTVTVYAQPATKAFYTLPENIQIDETDLWEPLQVPNFEVVYCNFFVFTGEDSLVIVRPPKGKHVAFKGVMLSFPKSPIFTGAVIFSTPFHKNDEMALDNIRLMLVDNSLIELDRAWLLDAGYYEVINRLMEILQVTTKKTM